MSQNRRSSEGKQKKGYKALSRLMNKEEMRTVSCRVAILIEFHLETKTICNFISRRIAICAQATCQQTIVHQRNRNFFKLSRCAMQLQ